MRSYVVAAFVFALLGAGIPVLSAPASDQVLPKHACNGPRCAAIGDLLSPPPIPRQTDAILALTGLLPVPAAPTGAAGSAPTGPASTSTPDVTIEPSTTTATSAVKVTATTTSLTSSTALPTNMIVHHARGSNDVKLVSVGAGAGLFPAGPFSRPLVGDIENIEDASISATATASVVAASTKSSSGTDTVTSMSTQVRTTSSVQTTTTVTSTVTEADSPKITDAVIDVGSSEFNLII